MSNSIELGAIFGDCEVLGVDKCVQYSYLYGKQRRQYYKCRCLLCDEEFSRDAQNVVKGSPCRGCVQKRLARALNDKSTAKARSVRLDRALSLVGKEYNNRLVIEFTGFVQSGSWQVPFYIVKCLVCGKELKLGKPTILCNGCRNCNYPGITVLNGIPRRTDKRGYVWLKVPGHPMASKNGWCQEHRLVMAAHLGRDLEPHEDVHHIRAWEKSNNDISNLELWSRKHPVGSRVKDIIDYSKEMLALYEPEALSK